MNGCCPRSSNQSGKPPIERSSIRTRASPRIADQPGQRHGERRQADDRDPEAVEQPAQAAHPKGDEDRRLRGDPLLVNQATHDRGQTHDRRDRQVDLAADDHERHAQDHDRLLDAQLEQVDLVLDRQVAGRGEGVERHDHDEDDRAAGLPSGAAEPGRHVAHRRAPPALDGSPSVLRSRRRSRIQIVRSRPRIDLVRGDRQQDQQPQDRVPQELAHLRQRIRLCCRSSISVAPSSAPIIEPDAAEDVDPADHDRRDHLQLEALGGRDGDVPEARQEHEPGQARRAPRTARMPRRRLAGPASPRSARRPGWSRSRTGAGRTGR